jgi:hypothetical protein
MYCSRKLTKVKYGFLLTLIFSASFCAGQMNYNAELIPMALKSRANATIRDQEVTVDMQSPNEVNYTVKKAITILNKNGDEHADLALFYNKSMVVKSIKGEVYDEFGKLSSKFSQSDFKDESAVQGFSLFEDSRVKYFMPSKNTYPYTIVYQYEIRFKQNLAIPDWSPKPANDVSVAQSSYTFICKPADQFRINVKNYPEKAVENITDKQKTLVWKVSNLAGIKPEPYSPNKESYLPTVKIAPQQFNFFNYKGNYANWQELGKWIYESLLKGRGTLPPSTVMAIKELIKDEPTDKGKAKLIYQYMQNRTRYISVQIGIGGFQPVLASDVDRLGYGDCKGLVNYMQSLLSVAGIESYYCIVEAGSEKISLDPDYASMSQGNHIILCLPLKNDTTWLECTAQQIPFGYLGDFTDDRLVLACTPSGGKLMHTPKLAAQKNLQIRNADLTVTKDGNVNGKLITVYSGSQYSNNEYIVGKSVTEQQKLLKDIYDIDNIDFDEIKYSMKKDENPAITENLSINIRNYGSLNSGRMFLLVNAFNQKRNIQEVKNRTMPVYINRGYTDFDTIVYQLPENATLLTEISDKHISNEFGEYDAKAKIEGNKLIYTRKLMINDGTFPAESYTKFSNFISQVNTADHLKLVFNLKK